jgi:hypothetical protein
MDRPNRIVSFELVAGTMLSLLLYALPWLGLEEQFWWRLGIWLAILALCLHLLWSWLLPMPPKLGARARTAIVLTFGLLFVWLVYPRLGRVYAQENRKEETLSPQHSRPPAPVPLPPAAAAPSPAKPSPPKLEPRHSAVDRTKRTEKGKGSRESQSVPKPKQPAGGSTVIQQGQNNISQIGENNQATINPPKQELLLSEPQASAVTEALRGFGGRRLKIILNRETEETWTFANNLAAALRAAGVSVQIIPTIAMGVPIPPGISFLLYKTKEDWPFVNAIANELVKSKVVTPPIKWDESGDDDLPILRITPY